MTYAIKAENLGKSYLIGHRKKEAYSTLRDTLAHGVQNIWQRLRHPNIPSQDNQIEEFWALKDVSFEIQPGDRVGIIGRNGAGKSTLLKVLSRITEPTTGKFITRGRVASLLEVGTGFHPELTGRENIYLNGSILGMTRADVKRQFDAIVDFSGVEKFLDTPVKRYSSGMYVRLAFAVAAHLDPDILIVDEVLAVGDAEFQKKCLGKMEEVGKEGRTVVFVSHNMGAVSFLCDRSIMLGNGRVAHEGSVNDCINKYLSQGTTDILNRVNNRLDTNPRIENVRCITSSMGGIQKHGFPLEIQVTIETPIKIESPALSIQIVNSDNKPVVHFLNLNEETPFLQEPGKHICTLSIPKLRIYPGQYSLNINFANKFKRQKFETLENISPFHVEFDSKPRDYWGQNGSAVYAEDASWSFKEVSSND